MPDGMGNSRPGWNHGRSGQSEPLPPPDYPPEQSGMVHPRQGWKHGKSGRTEPLPPLRTQYDDEGSCMSCDSDLWDQGVQFRVPSGDMVRYVPTRVRGKLEECLLPGGEGDWRRIGEARLLTFDPRTRTVASELGHGAVLPAELLYELLPRFARLCDSAGVPHNFHGQTDGSSTPLDPPSHDSRDWQLEQTWGAATRGPDVPGVRREVSRRGSAGLVRVPADELRRLREIADNWEKARPAAPPPRRRPRPPAHGMPEHPPWAYEAWTGRVAGASRAVVVGAGAGAAQARALALQLHGHGLPSTHELRVLVDGGGGAAPTRSAVLEQLQWLSDGLQPGDAAFLGIVCRAHVGEGGGFLCSDGKAVTARQVRGLISSLPPASTLCIVSDTAPASGGVVDLPYKLVARGDGGFSFGESTAPRDEPQCGVVQLSILGPSAGGTEAEQLGQLVAALRRALDRPAAPTYLELADSLRYALSFAPLGLLPMLSSAQSFDALTDCFPIGLMGPAPPRTAAGAGDPTDDMLGMLEDHGVRGTDTRRFWRDFTYAFDTLEKSSAQARDHLPLEPVGAPPPHGAASGPPQPAGEGSPVERLVRGVYLRHNPRKCRLARTLVDEFPGRALELLQLLARKYNDPTIVSAYDASWDTASDVPHAAGGGAPYLQAGDAPPGVQRAYPPGPGWRRGMMDVI